MPSTYCACVMYPCSYIFSRTRLRRASASSGLTFGSKADGEAMIPAIIAASQGSSTAAQGSASVPQPGWAAPK